MQWRQQQLFVFYFAMCYLLKKMLRQDAFSILLMVASFFFFYSFADTCVTAITSKQTEINYFFILPIHTQLATLYTKRCFHFLFDAVSRFKVRRYMFRSVFIWKEKRGQSCSVRLSLKRVHTQKWKHKCIHFHFSSEHSIIQIVF